MKICPACSREYGDEHESCLDDGVVLVRLDTGTTTRGQDLIGTIVDGRYRIERIVGRGGMGTVYACRHVVVGKPFAIKVLRPGIERSEEILQRFIREAQAANAVKSRHICEMTDFGQLGNGAFYVVMDLLDGHSLTRALREKRLDRVALKQVFIQIAETLFKAHNADIVHRDLKPDNVVLVEDDGNPNFVKLVDFGIAKMMQNKASNLTETGVILGTPYYMSPEQARGDELDHRSDIYAMGVMMYRAFTGKLPFVADTAMGVLTRHLTELPEPPSKLIEIDAQLERLILRCLEKKPIDRFQTMSQVAHALMSITDHPTNDPVSATFDERGGQQVSSLGPASEPTPTRLASPMAMSQRREAWDDGNRAQASSAPVPQSQPPRPQPQQHAHAPSHGYPPQHGQQIPGPVPLPNMPTGQHAPVAQHPAHAHAPLPYPHHLTPQAFAASGMQAAAGTQAGSGAYGVPALFDPDSQDSGTHVMATGAHAVHQPVTYSNHGQHAASGQHAAYGQHGSEPNLPAHMQGEAATNRGVSARISVLPQPSQKRWLLAGVAIVALVGVGLGAVALSGVASNDAKPASSSSAPERADKDDSVVKPSGETTSALPTAEPTSDPTLPAPSADAAPSASTQTPTRLPQVGPRPPRPGPAPDDDDGGGPTAPKPVDDVRDPFE